MKSIHFAALRSNGSVRAVVETATSGGQWGHPVLLSAVDVPAAALPAFLSARAWTGARVKDWNVVESWRVDARHRGPRSNYGQTLAALIDEARKEGAEIDGADREGLVAVSERAVLAQVAANDPHGAEPVQTARRAM